MGSTRTDVSTVWAVFAYFGSEGSGSWKNLVSLWEDEESAILEQLELESLRDSCHGGFERAEEYYSKDTDFEVEWITVGKLDTSS